MANGAPVISEPFAGNKFHRRVDVCGCKNVVVRRVPVLGIDEARGTTKDVDIAMAKDGGGSGIERTPDTAIETEAREKQRRREHDTSAMMQRTIAKNRLSDGKILGHG